MICFVSVACPDEAISRKKNIEARLFESRVTPPRKPRVEFVRFVTPFEKIAKGSTSDASERGRL